MNFKQMQNKAEDLYRNKDYQASLSIVEELLKHITTDAGLFIHRGNCNMVLGNLQKALESFLKAIELDPTRTVAYINYAGILFQNGMSKEAAKFMEDALAFQPNLRNDPNFMSQYGIFSRWAK